MQVLRPHGYVLLQYAMEDAIFVHRDHYDRGGGGGVGVEPAEAFARGNPHVYFRNNAANTSVSRALLEAVGQHRGRGHAASLLETALQLFEAHSGVAASDVPHRAGFYSKARGGRVWAEGKRFQWAGAGIADGGPRKVE